MELSEQIKSDLPSAMKSGEATKVSTLRLVLSSMHNLEIEKRKKGKEGLTKEDELAVLRREAKRRKEAIAVYTDANRDDLAKKETEELEIISSYLPPQLKKEDIEKIVGRAIDKNDVGNFGLVMRTVMEEVAGRADAKEVSEIIKEQLDSLG